MSLMFVTGLFDIGRPNFDDYLRWSQQLIDLDLPLIFFHDHSIKLIPRSRTRMVLVEKIPLEDRVEKLEEHWHKYTTDNPSKDTPRFAAMTLSKFSLLRQAIELNIDSPSHYAWIDSGIAKNFDLELVGRHLHKLPLSPLVRSMIVRKIDSYDSQFTLAPRNGMAGGFFYGPTRKIWDMADRILERSNLYLNEGLPGLEQEFMVMDYIDNSQEYDVYYGDYYDLLYNCFFAQRLTQTVIVIDNREAKKRS